MLLLASIIILFLTQLYVPTMPRLNTEVLQAKREFYMNQIESMKLYTIQNEIQDAYEKRQRERLVSLLIQYNDYDNSGNFLEENIHLRKFIFYAS